MSYRIVETNERVSLDADFVSYFRWRAERKCRELNKRRIVPYYRHEVHRVGKRWEVWSMQNRAVSIL